jgi:hypothetical protein
LPDAADDVRVAVPPVHKKPAERFEEMTGFTGNAFTETFIESEVVLHP